MGGPVIGDPLYRLGWLESAVERLAGSDPAAAVVWEDYRRLARGDG